MQCRYCRGLVLWNFPIKPNGENKTECQSCGAENSQLINEEDIY